MTATPTDLQILDLIFEHYLAAYLEDPAGSSPRNHKNYVPMDLDNLASQLGTDKTLLSSRLFDHLDKKYGYRVDENSHIFLFAPAIGSGQKVDRYVVNFPYLSSIVAGMRDENRKYRLATGMAFVSLTISLTSLLFSLLR